jgi:phosphoglycolate phosphatase
MSMSCAQAVASPIGPFGLGAKVKEARLNIQVFCDLDGPLIDVSRRYCKTYQLAIAEVQAQAQAQGRSLSLTPLSASQFWQMKQERMPDADIAFCSGLRHEQIDLFLAKVVDIVNQPILLQEDCVQPGALQSLQLLKRLGASLSVVTLRCQSQAVQLLQQFQLDSFFDQVCGAEDRFSAYRNYTEGKQAILQGLMARLAPSDHDQSWIIGDTEADVQAGQALGLSTLALTCGMRSHSYLQRLQPTTVQADLRSATDYLMAHVMPSC